MSKTEQLQKHTMFLYEGDYRRLQEYYPEIGAAKVIRKVVRKHLISLDEKAKVDEDKVEFEGTL